MVSSLKKSIDVILDQVNYRDLNPVDFLYRAAHSFPTKVAYQNSMICKSYLELANDVEKLSAKLISLKIQRGDKVALLYNNGYISLLAHFSVPVVGACLVPINTRLDKSNIEYILHHSEAKVLLTNDTLLHNSFYKFVDQVILNWEKDVINCQHEQTCDTKLPFKKFPLSNPISENSIISINYTSGTSGKPKGAMCSYRGAYLNTLGECIHAKLTSATKYLWVLPMFHCNGWCFPWAVTAVGGTHICIDKVSADKIINAICKYKITHFCASPTVLRILIESDKIKNILGLKITVLTAGSALSQFIVDFFKDSEIELIQVYGLTETYGPHTICDLDEVPKKEKHLKQKLQGIVSIHGVFVDVVDENMNSVPYDGNTLGEVVVRGNNVMLGYFKDEKSTNKSFSGGWFHTGDLAVVHPDGYIEIRDRIKDIIISGGENISSLQIENALCLHSSVKLCAVLPKKDSKWGEVPIAIVELVGDKNIKQQKLIEFSKSVLPSYMCPKEIIFSSIPLTSTGKIKKYQLKDKFVAMLRGEID